MTADDRAPLAALIYVMPGEIHWSETPRRYKTVLGSCVSVCLFDRRLGIGGLNHFILPHGRDGACDARYGDIAVPRLIARLRALGCRDLVAKVFGGASVLPIGAASSVGDANAEAAFCMLREAGIPVLARRTGGRHGVVIQYRSDSGEVLLREIAEAVMLPEAA